MHGPVYIRTVSIVLLPLLPRQSWSWILILSSSSGPSKHYGLQPEQTDCCGFTMGAFQFLQAKRNLCHSNPSYVFSRYRATLDSGWTRLGHHERILCPHSGAHSRLRIIRKPSPNDFSWRPRVA
ncbi:hypothetical protein DFH06DRAFT_1172733 [Mycena polygramma]|nr:hypothetical protein DFH06DRAFT_1172733 [Mycena polygramma]